MKSSLSLFIVIGLFSVSCGSGRFAGATEVKKALDAVEEVEKARDQSVSGSDASRSGGGSSSNVPGDLPDDSDGRRSNPRGGGSEEDESLDNSAGAEILGDDCDGLSGKLRRVHISGSSNTHSLTGEDGVVLKVSGSQNQVTMRIQASASQASLQSLCLDVTGNQNSVTVEIAAEVGSVFVKARGNSPSVELVTVDGGKLNAISTDARGNGSRIVLKGAGVVPCESSQPQGIVCE